MKPQEIHDHIMSLPDKDSRREALERIPDEYKKFFMLTIGMEFARNRREKEERERHSRLGAV